MSATSTILPEVSRGSVASAFDLYSEALGLAIHTGLHAKHPDFTVEDLQADLRAINERVQKIHRMAAEVVGYEYRPAVSGGER